MGTYSPSDRRNWQILAAKRACCVHVTLTMHHAYLLSTSFKAVSRVGADEVHDDILGCWPRELLQMAWQMIARSASARTHSS